MKLITILHECYTKYNLVVHFSNSVGQVLCSGLYYSMSIILFHYLVAVSCSGILLQYPVPVHTLIVT